MSYNRLKNNHNEVFSASYLTLSRVSFDQFMIKYPKLWLVNKCFSIHINSSPIIVKLDPNQPNVYCESASSNNVYNNICNGLHVKTESRGITAVVG